MRLKCPDTKGVKGAHAIVLYARIQYAVPTCIFLVKDSCVGRLRVQFVARQIFYNKLSPVLLDERQVTFQSLFLHCTYFFLLGVWRLQCAAFGLGGVGDGFSYTRPRQFFSRLLSSFCPRASKFSTLSILSIFFFSPVSYLADQVAFYAPDARSTRQLAQLAAAS